MLSVLVACQASLFLPIISAYRIEPNSLTWGGYVEQPGQLSVRVDAERKAPRRLVVIQGRSTSVKIEDSAQIELKKPGWVRFRLEGDPESVKGIELTGAPLAGAKFNQKERRNAASVHIRWPEAEGLEGEWFYNEIRGKTDPLYTYYMACGFKRGYFGMQVNSPTERRVIFSIWDSGSEAVDRNKVAADNRVQLLAKGKGVVADSFGNEGTGGHSHLVFPWKTGEPQRFLVHAVPEGNTTVYTGYFKASDAKDWILIASFRAPKDGERLSRLYSFIEDFGGEFGYRTRKAQFGPAWIANAKGVWVPLQRGEFTHDATGGKDRFDYDFRMVPNGFELQNGGFEGRSPRYGTPLTARYELKPPQIDFSRLPKS